MLTITVKQFSREQKHIFKLYMSHQAVIYLEEAKPTTRIRNEALVDNCVICRFIILTISNMHLLQLQLSLCFVSGGVFIIKILGVLWIFKLIEMSRTWTKINH